MLAQRVVLSSGIPSGLQLGAETGDGLQAVFIDEGQLQAGGGFGQAHPHTDATIARGFVQQAHPGHVAIAVDGEAGAQVGQGGEIVLREDAPVSGARQRLHAVDRHADQLLVQVEVTQAIAVVEDRVGVMQA